jgi:chromosome segregation ATPase
MVAETSRLGKKLFPKIRVIVAGGTRRAPFVLTPGAQIAAMSGLLCGALLLCYLGTSQVSAIRRIAEEERAVVRAEIANADLQDGVARLQDKLARTAGDRVAVADRLSSLTEETRALSDRLATAEAKLKAARDLQKTQQPAPSGQPQSGADRIAQLQAALAHVQLDIHALEAEGATLAARLNKTQADRAEESALYRRYQASLKQARSATQRRGGR